MFDMQPKHKFLVAIDSDGCAFDSMEIKHKECFIPHTINSFGLQAVSKYAREVAEFVNLYSKSRGINRFPALVETLDYLARRPEVQARGATVRVAPTLRQWVARETRLGNPALEAAVARTGDAALAQALAWSKAVNQTVEQFVHGVPPFPWVRQSLEKLAPLADLIVASATPGEALEREWSEHGLRPLVAAVCGQEVGTKKEILAVAHKYPPNQVLMLGDAPGDHRAAEANSALFFPINPGDEEASWQRFFQEGIERFLAGTFAGAYQALLLSEFDRRLPAAPPWPLTPATGSSS